jgi:hypothetical protein
VHGEIATGALGPIQGNIRNRDQFQKTHVGRRGYRSAHAHRDRNTDARDVYRFDGDRQSDCVRSLPNGHLGTSRKRNTEFFSTITANKIIGTKALREPANNILQDKISNKMAMRVIYFLEVIDVQEEESDFGLETASPLKLIPKQI